MLRPWCAGRCVTHEVDAAALLGGVEDLGDGGFKPFLGIRYRQLHTSEATTHPASQKDHPKRLSFRRANSHAKHLTTTIGVYCHSDYGGDRDNATGLPYFDLGRVDRQVGPVAFQRTIQKSVDALIGLAGQSRHLALGNA
ncbi:hypothetical protein D3C75_570160 [compost metagenome]